MLMESSGNLRQKKSVSFLSGSLSYPFCGTLDHRCFPQPPLALTHAPMVSHAGGVVMPSPALASPAGSPHSAHPAPQHPAAPQNPPCSTLFIANLGPNVAEHELKDIFSSYNKLGSHVGGPIFNFIQLLVKFLATRVIRA
ncbi:RNA-binding protein with multiple splicing 2 [Halocaridina rubra]|uniref:RNA-binding protein with multiple splicing 2 n=1 Tax=Halocaridina rubra TaxID=373956 RepID=A0AAN8XWD1_HALRR